MSGHERERLSAYLDRELPEAERAAVESHLAACAECRDVLASLAVVDDAAAELPAEAPAGYFEDFAARVRSRIEASGAVKAPRRTRRLPRWTWAVAAALLLAVVTPLSWREGRPTARTPSGAVTPAPPAAVPAPAAVRAPAAVPAKPAPAAAQAAQDAARAALEQRSTQESAGVAPAPAPGGGASVRGRAPATTDAGAVRAKAAANTAPAAAEPQRKPQPDASASEAESKAETQTWDFAEAPRPAGSLATAPGAPPAEPTVAAEAARTDRADAARTARADAPVALRQARTPAEGAGAVAQPAIAGGPFLPPPDAAYTKLLSARPSGIDAWLALRERWRAFALAHASDPRSDEARVRVVACSLEALRAGGGEAVRGALERDAAEYLARADARQAPRVRALLEAAAAASRR